jgi:molecular chaperone GrpE (heat shock protein)
MDEENWLDQSELLLSRIDFAAERSKLEREHIEQTRSLLMSFIQVMDSFDRLFSSLEDSLETIPEQQLSVMNSARLISRQLERAFENAGVSRIPALNLLCDSDKHFVVDVRESPGVPEDTIVQEVLRGYEWEGEILRLPHVIIAGKPSPVVEEK